MEAEALKQSELWCHGPPWLVEGKEMWPKFENTTEPPSVCFDEMRVSNRTNNCTELVATVRAPALSSVFYQQRYSDIKRLFRVTAFVLRFLQNLKSRENGMAATGPLSTDEYGAAEILWLREMQQAVLESPRFESLKNQLGLYTDDNGDIVTVMEEGKSSRGIWKVGKVLDVHPGNDGLIGGATIEVASDNGKRRRLRRPIQKLFPLEVRETRVADVEEHARPIACTPQRQRRQAAIEGEMRRHQKLFDLNMAESAAEAEPQVPRAPEANVVRDIVVDPSPAQAAQDANVQEEM
ncbi:hypothetical protein P5673_018014 [Acropora cervicornis]|uniref:DUF5641 domain-containing protein n=1 Tax=Acropora cervicornis TaxID=6130 RepID=A0AAD9QDR0_ACRCE|nr:hypothetical protein P5673_018014 [Acropora cervicornis]